VFWRATASWTSATNSWTLVCRTSTCHARPCPDWVGQRKCCCEPCPRVMRIATGRHKPTKHGRVKVVGKDFDECLCIAGCNVVGTQKEGVGQASAVRGNHDIVRGKKGGLLPHVERSQFDNGQDGMRQYLYNFVLIYNGARLAFCCRRGRITSPMCKRSVRVAATSQ
jgi:hypothetical protein